MVRYPIFIDFGISFILSYCPITPVCNYPFVQSKNFFLFQSINPYNDNDIDFVYLHLSLSPPISSLVKTRPLILLAEDSKIQARMISMVLNRYNFDVEVATDGEMALEMFQASPKYDLILMVCYQHDRDRLSSRDCAANLSFLNIFF